MSTQNGKEIVKSLLESFNREAFDQAASLVTQDLTLVDVAAGQTLRGPEGLRMWFQGFKKAFPDMRAEITNLVVAGDWVFDEHMGRGTNTGPLAGPDGDVPPTGRSVDLSVAHVYQIRDGKIAAIRSYYDMATFLRQLGLMPA